uniref:START domain-containing protein n=1 Tax=Arcella intermedia TaxID=1963864 RepID=A0A6B2LBC4_9EUKA
MKAHMVGILGSVLYDVLHDSQYRQSWDGTMEEGITIQTLDAHNDIGYFAGKSPFFGISGRDFCNQRSWWVSPDRTEFIIINHSVIHPSVPERKPYVRAWSYSTGYRILVDPDDVNSCFFTYCTQTDLKGWIPDKLVNKAMKTFAPNLVQKMKEVVPAYIPWKQDHQPFDKPWLSHDPYHWEAAIPHAHQINPEPFAWRFDESEQVPIGSPMNPNGIATGQGKPPLPWWFNETVGSGIAENERTLWTDEEENSDTQQEPVL